VGLIPTLLLAFVIGAVDTDKRLADIVAELRSADPGVRVHAVDSLAELAARGGADATEAARALAARVEDSDAKVRCESVWHLGRLGEKARAHAAVLIRALRHDPDECVRSAAAQAINQIDIRTSIALDAMRRVVDEPAAAGRSHAIEYLGRVDATSVERIAGALEDRQWIVGDTAARVLHGMGERASAAVPALRRAARRHEAGVMMMVSVQAARALQRISRDDADLDLALQVLAAGLRDEQHEWVQGPAVEGLEEMGPRAAPTLPALERLLAKTGNPYFAELLRHAIDRIRPR